MLLLIGIEEMLLVFFGNSRMLELVKNKLEVKTQTKRKHFKSVFTCFESKKIPKYKFQVSCRLYSLVFHKK